jgi:hypothetical protein
VKARPSRVMGDPWRGKAQESTGGGPRITSGTVGTDWRAEKDPGDGRVGKAPRRAACRSERSGNQEATSGGERASKGATAARQGKALEGKTP